MVHLPITPDNITLTANGRWTWSGVDITDHRFWWKCADCGRSYQETLAVMTASGDGLVACPDCKARTGLCSTSGCWEQSEAKLECKCGATTTVCRQHVDKMSNEMSHCGPGAISTFAYLPGRQFPRSG